MWRKTLSTILISLLLVNPCWATVDLNGDADYITVTDSASVSPTGNMSIACWVNFDSTASRQDFVQKWYVKASAPAEIKQSYLLTLGVTATKIQFFVSNDGTSGKGTTASAAINTGQWYHVVGVYDGTNIHLYINGAEVTPAVAHNTGIYDGNRPLEFGRGVDGGVSSYHLNGKITEVMIYNIALTASEITQLYNACIKSLPLQIQSSNIGGYWGLDDHPIQTGINNLVFKDLSGNGNSGTGVDADGDSLIIGESVLSYPSEILGGL